VCHSSILECKPRFKNEHRTIACCRPGETGNPSSIFNLLFLVATASYDLASQIGFPRNISVVRDSIRSNTPPLSGRLIIRFRDASNSVSWFNPSVFAHNLQCEPVRGVDTREECHWSHACSLQASRRGNQWHPRVEISVDNAHRTFTAGQ
jgi:hypothetical protein